MSARADTRLLVLSAQSSRVYSSHHRWRVRGGERREGAPTGSVERAGKWPYVDEPRMGAPCSSSARWDPAGVAPLPRHAWLAASCTSAPPATPSATATPRRSACSAVGGASCCASCSDTAAASWPKTLHTCWLKVENSSRHLERQPAQAASCDHRGLKQGWGRFQPAGRQSRRPYPTPPPPARAAPPRRSPTLAHPRAATRAAACEAHAMPRRSLTAAGAAPLRGSSRPSRS